MNPDITIEIPFLPDYRLSPNWQPTSMNPNAIWALKRRYAEPLQQAAALAAKRPAQLHGTINQAMAQTTFIVARGARRDGDNWLARAKAAYDGLVKAGLLTDDAAKNLSHLPVIFMVDKTRAPRTVIELEILNGNQTKGGVDMPRGTAVKEEAQTALEEEVIEDNDLQELIRQWVDDQEVAKELRKPATAAAKNVKDGKDRIKQMIPGHMTEGGKRVRIGPYVIKGTVQEEKDIAFTRGARYDITIKLEPQ